MPLITNSLIHSLKVPLFLEIVQPGHYFVMLFIHLASFIIVSKYSWPTNIIDSRLNKIIEILWFC